MSGLTRREWSTLVLGGFVAAGRPVFGRSRPDSVVRGVTIGVQSYSFRDRPLEAAIDAMVKAGLSSCELWQGHVEPEAIAKRLRAKDPGAREALRRWRIETPLDHFRAVRKRFDQAGITLSAYNYSFRDDFSDEEIARGFEMAKALGVSAITASSNVKTTARVAPLARAAGVRVAMHNHSRIDPNEFATPESLVEAVRSGGAAIAINLDIGHFVAAGFDPVAFLEEHHDRIVTLHIKDRKRNQGENVPFGKGDTPIAAVLQLLRDRRWAIPANIEYEYRGADAVEEVSRCLSYCRQVLES